MTSPTEPDNLQQNDILAWEGCCSNIRAPISENSIKNTDRMDTINRILLAFISFLIADYFFSAIPEDAQASANDDYANEDSNSPYADAIVGLIFLWGGIRLALCCVDLYFGDVQILHVKKAVPCSECRKPCDMEVYKQKIWEKETRSNETIYVSKWETRIHCTWCRCIKDYNERWAETPRETNYNTNEAMSDGTLPVAKEVGEDDPLISPDDKRENYSDIPLATAVIV